MTSTARLIEKTKRLAPSMGSHGSAAPVSRTAQPPKKAPAATSAMADWRAPAVIFKTAPTINAPKKRLYFAVVGASVAHGAFTLKSAAIPNGIFYLHT